MPGMVTPADVQRFERPHYDDGNAHCNSNAFQRDRRKLRIRRTRMGKVFVFSFCSSESESVILFLL